MKRIKFEEAHQEISLITQPVQIHRKLSQKCSFIVSVLSSSQPSAIVSNKKSPNPGPSPFLLTINDMATSQKGKTNPLMTSMVVILTTMIILKMVMIIFNMIISFYLPYTTASGFLALISSRQHWPVCIPSFDSATVNLDCSIKQKHL